MNMCLELCKPREVKVKDGKTIIIRSPQMSDLESLLEYVNSLVEEDALIKLREKMTLEKEKEWLEKSLKEIKENKRHYLVAVIDGEVVSGGELRKDFGRQSHVTEFGIAVKKEYRRLGIGTAMMKSLMDVAKKDKDIKVLHLDVYADNEPAIAMYEKLGFKEVARLKDRAQIKDRLGDQLIMDFEGEL